MPDKVGRLTAQEKAFVGAMAETENREFARHVAKYRSAGSSSQLMARPQIQEEIRKQQLARLHNDLLPASMNVLAAALDMATPGVPWGSRITAAKIVQDRVFGAGDSGQRKDLSDMSADEIKDAMGELQRRLAEMARPVVDLEASEPDPTDEPTETGAFD